MDCSPPGSSVHGIFQARVLEWVAIAFSGKEQSCVLWLLMTVRLLLQCHNPVPGLARQIARKQRLYSLCWLHTSAESTFACRSAVSWLLVVWTQTCRTQTGQTTKRGKTALKKCLALSNDQAFQSNYSARPCQALICLLSLQRTLDFCFLIISF